MLDVPVPAATLQWPRPLAVVRSHAFDRDCFCFDADSFLSFNFNHTAIGSRAASQLSLTRWSGSSDRPAPKYHRNQTVRLCAGLPCLPMTDLPAWASSVPRD